MAAHIAVAVGFLLRGGKWSMLRTYQQRFGVVGRRAGLSRAERPVAEVEPRAVDQIEARFRSLVQNVSDLIIVVGADRTMRYHNPSVERILGYTSEELAGTKACALVHPDDAPRMHGVCAEVLNNPLATPSAEVRLRHRDGSWRHVEVLATSLLDDLRAGGIVLNCRDITERKAFERQLAHQAVYDPLTALPNRALFLDRLDQALARAAGQQASIAVLCLDLDRFQLINHSLGHAAGDELLRAVAQRLPACLRARDTVARLGGDEFAILLENLSDAHEAMLAAERIMDALRAPFVLRGHEVFTTASIGIACGMPEGKTPGDFMRGGEVALYQAKSHGGARSEVFDTNMHIRSLDRLKLEADLRRALERSEFVIHYQPTVDLRTGRVKGLEALVRWMHPEQGLVCPAEFIPLAEETGLIHPLGRWVLEVACKQAQAWHQQYPGTSPLVIGVNLSPRQVQQPDLVEYIAGVLQRTGLDSHLLQLEITESAIMEDALSARHTLQALKDLGVQLAIDDFGTGYSSLSYLKLFPVDMLKVDKAFVAGLGNNARDTAIVQAMITLAHSLGMQVTAEGVESAAQLAQLQALGSQLGQGYYFAKPLAEERLALFFDEEIPCQPSRA